MQILLAQFKKNVVPLFSFAPERPPPRRATLPLSQACGVGGLPLPGYHPASGFFFVY